MADLAGALDQLLTARYLVGEPKRPATHRQGLTARMNGIEREFTTKGGRKGAEARRAAEAAGISLRQWQRWRTGAVKPTPASLRKLEAAFTRLVTLPRLRKRLKTKPVPDRIKVTATIKWITSSRKQYNRTKHRTTTLVGMRPTMRATIRAWAMAGPEAAADVFERGAAEEHGADEINFEGDNVELEIPDDDQ